MNEIKSEAGISPVLSTDELERLARKARFRVGRINYADGSGSYQYIDAIGSGCAIELRKFAELVAANEREACAKVCDELEQNGFHFETYDGWDEVPAEACHCAAAIRARSNVGNHRTVKSAAFCRSGGLKGWASYSLGPTETKNNVRENKRCSFRYEEPSS